MNGTVLWLAITNACTLILLIASMRSTRHWIKACQKQMTKRWQETRPAETDQIATLLEEHSIRRVRVHDPDRDERMPDVGSYLPECPTCGPMTGITDTSVHQARVMAIHLNKGQLRTPAKEIEESPQSPTAATPGKAPHVHRIEVEISGGRSHGLLNGDITFKGVCDAGEGAPCRMWCNDPDCREEASENHDNHVLVDQGECGVIGSLNADPSYIPEAYAGPKTLLRSDFIELEQDIDEVTWRYAQESMTDPQRLIEYGRGLIAHGAGLLDYADNLTAYHGSLNALSEFLVGLAGAPEPRPGAPIDNTSGPSHPDCADDCRHRCPECRLGLGTHLECDPLCTHHKLASSQ